MTIFQCEGSCDLLLICNGLFLRLLPTIVYEITRSERGKSCLEILRLALHSRCERRKIPTE